MTSNQIKRILSGLGLSTAKNEVLVIPQFRTIICETRQGIDGEADQLKFDYDKDLLRIKEYYYKRILTPFYPYEVTGNQIKYFSVGRRLSAGDVVVIADYSNKTLTKVANIVSNVNFVLTLDASITFDPDNQKMYVTSAEEYASAVPSPRNSLSLLVYQPISDYSADTYVDIGSIIAIDTFNASIDTSLV